MTYSGLRLMGKRVFIFKCYSSMHQMPGDGFLNWMKTAITRIGLLYILIKKKVFGGTWVA